MRVRNALPVPPKGARPPLRLRENKQERPIACRALTLARGSPDPAMAVVHSQTNLLTEPQKHGQAYEREIRYRRDPKEPVPLTRDGITQMAHGDL